MSQSICLMAIASYCLMTIWSSYRVTPKQLGTNEGMLRSAYKNQLWECLEATSYSVELCTTIPELYFQVLPQAGF